MAKQSLSRLSTDSNTIVAAFCLSFSVIIHNFIETEKNKKNTTNKVSKVYACGPGLGPGSIQVKEKTIYAMTIY